MEINYRSSSNSFNANEILFHAQALADAFADALKQNNCIVMLPIALHDDIESGIKDIEDGNKITDGGDITKDPVGGGERGDKILDSLQSAIDYSKAQCFPCSLTLPRVDFSFDTSQALGSIKATLDVYNQIFKLPQLDLCQASSALRSTCLPDILRLLVLLLTAYASIMMLKNISSISLSAFIKGVISTIIERLFASLKMSLSIGDTNMACIINAMEEISSTLLPTDEEVRKLLTEEEREAIDFGKDKESIMNKYTSNLNKGINRLGTRSKKVEDDLNKLEGKLEDTFKIFSDSLKEASKEVNDLIMNMLALKSTFECEAKRSGTDVQEVIGRINKLIQIVNMLSAVALATARKDAYERACASNNSIKRLTDKELEDLKIKDIIEEYYEKEAEIIETPDGGIQILIKDDKPKEPVLNKLTLLQCSIDDFINDHTLDNIINKVEKENEDRGTVNRDPVERQRDFKYIPDGSYVLPPISSENDTIIENIVNIIYTPPEDDLPLDEQIKVDDDRVISIDDIINSIGLDGTSSEYKIQNDRNNASLRCRNTSDVLRALEDLRKNT